MQKPSNPRKQEQRDRNRLSAQAHRDRQKAKFCRLSQLVEDLQVENSTLRHQLAKMFSDHQPNQSNDQNFICDSISTLQTINNFKVPPPLPETLKSDHVPFSPADLKILDVPFSPAEAFTANYELPVKPSECIHTSVATRNSGKAAMIWSALAWVAAVSLGLFSSSTQQSIILHDYLPTPMNDMSTDLASWDTPPISFFPTSDDPWQDVPMAKNFLLSVPAASLIATTLQIDKNSLGPQMRSVVEFVERSTMEHTSLVGGVDLNIIFPSHLLRRV